jgi:Flp pilus assembly protein TadG
MKLPRRGSEAGAAAVEFALVLPVLMLLIFGIIDFGRMLNAKITITEAAREGARAAALVDADAGAARVTTAVDGLDVNTAIDGCPDAPDPNADATATVTYTFSFVTPLGALIGSGGEVELRSTGVMPCLS